MAEAAPPRTSVRRGAPRSLLEVGTSDLIRRERGLDVRGGGQGSSRCHLNGHSEGWVADGGAGGHCRARWEPRGPEGRADSPGGLDAGVGEEEG